MQKRAYKLLAALMKPNVGPGANLGGDWLSANRTPPRSPWWRGRACAHPRREVPPAVRSRGSCPA